MVADPPVVPPTTNSFSNMSRLAVTGPERSETQNDRSLLRLPRRLNSLDLNRTLPESSRAAVGISRPTAAISVPSLGAVW